MNREHDAQQDRPWIHLDHITGAASFTFRGATYELPGLYESIESAKEIAFKRARLMGWTG